MKVEYRGYEIDARRGKSLGGDVLLYYSVFRMGDGLEVTSGFTSGEEDPAQFVEYLKHDVDAHIEEEAQEAARQAAEAAEEEANRLDSERELLSNLADYGGGAD